MTFDLITCRVCSYHRLTSLCCAPHVDHSLPLLYQPCFYRKYLRCEATQELRNLRTSSVHELIDDWGRSPALAQRRGAPLRVQPHIAMSRCVRHAALRALVHRGVHSNTLQCIAFRIPAMAALFATSHLIHRHPRHLPHVHRARQGHRRDPTHRLLRKLRRLHLHHHRLHDLWHPLLRRHHRRRRRRHVAFRRSSGQAATQRARTLQVGPANWVFMAHHLL